MTAKHIRDKNKKKHSHEIERNSHREETRCKKALNDDCRRSDGVGSRRTMTGTLSFPSLQRSDERRFGM